MQGCWTGLGNSKLKIQYNGQWWVKMLQESWETVYSSISTGANNHFPPILRPSERGPSAGCIGQSPPNTGINFSFR